MRQPVTFPVHAFAGESSVLLHEALSSDMALLRLWACRDWSVLTDQSEERRALIFTVSQPGNHPHNWNRIVSAVLPACSAFVAALTGKEAPAKKEEPVRDVLLSPTASSVVSPSRVRSMALKSPIKTAPPVVEKSAPGVADKFQSKLREVTARPHLVSISKLCVIVKSEENYAIYLN